MRRIARDELQAALGDGSVRLVSALGGWAFAAVHIPGSVHFESPRAAFAALDPAERIVVYGCDDDCPAGIAAYRALIARGYRDVCWYAAGITDWKAAGLPLDGTGLEEHRCG